jgi:hypothetical protein
VISTPSGHWDIPVSGHDEQLGLGVWLDDHDPGALTASGLDHESARHDAGLEPVLRANLGDFWSVFSRWFPDSEMNG